MPYSVRKISRRKPAGYYRLVTKEEALRGYADIVASVILSNFNDDLYTMMMLWYHGHDGLLILNKTHDYYSYNPARRMGQLYPRTSMTMRDSQLGHAILNTIGERTRDVVLCVDCNEEDGIIQIEMIYPGEEISVLTSDSEETIESSQ